MSIRLRNIEIFSEAVAHTRFFLFVKTVKNHYLGAWEEIVSCINPIGRRCSQQSLVINMNYTPQHIANYFLERAEIDGAPLSPLKLIKLVYIAYGWYLALTGKKIFNEPIEAWKHGPVIPSIYHEFKEFGSNHINRRAYDLDLDTDEFYAPQIREEDEDVRLILDRVWAVYRRFSGWALREKTHEKNSPWSKVFVDNVRGITLCDDDIKSHFTDKIGEYLTAANEVHAGKSA